MAAQLQTPVLSDRVAIVTGGGQGLGRAFAHALSAAGATVVVAELDAARGERVAGEVRESGGQAVAVPTDVSDPDSVERMVAATRERTGRIDVLVNNAAIFSTLQMRPFEEIPLDEWNAVMRVNVTGPFLCCRAVLPAMRAGGYGRIISLSSTTVTIGRPNYLHYVTSKAAVVGMTRAMAREVGSDGITVNALLPGATFTEVERATVSPAQKAAIVATQCIPRPETPADLVGMVVFLASEAAGFVTGQAIAVDGGASHR